MSNSNLLNELEAFTSCDVGDALRALKVEGGYLPHVKLMTPRNNPTKLIGLAYTVELVDSSDKASETFNGQLHWMDTVEKNQVVVISAPLNLPNAVFGGLMGARGVHLGALGAVVSGNVRDTQELEDLGLTVFASGTSSLGAKNFTRPSRVNQGVTIRAPSHIAYEPTVVQPNDIVVGDEDGVCIIPKELLGQVIEQCKKSTEIDAKCLKDIQNGQSIHDTFKIHR